MITMTICGEKWQGKNDYECMKDPNHTGDHAAHHDNGVVTWPVERRADSGPVIESKEGGVVSRMGRDT
jgi:hypothetical protein